MDLFIHFCFSFRFLPDAVSFHRIFKLILASEFEKSARSLRLKNDINVLFHEEQDRCRKVLTSSRICGSRVTNPVDFYRLLHGAVINGGSGSTLIIMKAVVVHKDGVPTPYSYEFHYISTYDVP